MQSKVNILIIALVVVIVVIGAILIFGGSPEPLPEEPENGEEEVVSGVGTITFVDLEGGFYGIVTDAGDSYLPINLDEDYEEDGLRVDFIGEVVEDHVDIYMWGIPIELMGIHVVEEEEEEEGPETEE